MNREHADRYVSFQDIDCNGNARMLMDYLRSHLNGAGAKSPWAAYFLMKLNQRDALGQDDLLFVGSQINALRSYFEELGDEHAQLLLEQIEEECC